MSLLIFSILSRTTSQPNEVDPTSNMVQSTSLPWQQQQRHIIGMVTATTMVSSTAPPSVEHSFTAKISIKNCHQQNMAINNNSKRNECPPFAPPNQYGADSPTVMLRVSMGAKREWKGGLYDVWYGVHQLSPGAHNVFWSTVEVHTDGVYTIHKRCASIQWINLGSSGSLKVMILLSI